MTTTSWIKAFGALALADLSSIPNRLHRHILAILGAFFRFQIRKAYEEKSLFFRLLFMPVTMIMMISSKIKAHRRGLSLGAFLKLEMAELEVEARMLKQAVYQQRTMSMEWLANVMPGATVNDYEDLIEKQPFRSLMFLRNGLWKLILGGDNKK